MTQTAKPEITATAIYRVTEKSTRQECYFVPSDSQPDVYYQTCWNAATNGWTCTCKAGQVASQYGRSATCKHSRAAQLVIVERKNRERAEFNAKVQAEAAVWEAEAARYQAEKEQREAAAYDARMALKAREQEREQWNEFQFQCGAYNHYWN